MELNSVECDVYNKQINTTEFKHIFVWLVYSNDYSHIQINVNDFQLLLRRSGNRQYCKSVKFNQRIIFQCVKYYTYASNKKYIWLGVQNNFQGSILKIFLILLWTINLFSTSDLLMIIYYGWHRLQLIDISFKHQSWIFVLY